MHKKIRTAILGCGGFAHRHAANLSSLSDDIELVAFCDRNIQNALNYCKAYTAGEAGVFTDHHAMIEAVPLDLLVVALPPFAHTDEVQLAAEAGIHLFIEKPIALTSEQAWSMVEAVESSGVRSQVGFMFRFGEAIETVRGLIRSGEAGKPGLMTARYFCNALHAPWWRERDKSGGQLVEQVIHMIDLMRHLMGEPVSVFSRQENLFHQDTPGYSIEDVSATIFAFENGALGVVYATNGAIPGKWINDYRLVSEKLTAEFANSNNAVLHFTAEEPIRSQTIQSERNVHLSEMQDLIRAIRTGGETRTPIREGALSLDMALKAAESAATRKEVFFQAQPDLPSPLQNER